MDISGIVAQVASHAFTTGLFESVNSHEPKSVPGNGLTCSVWANSIGPLPRGSGLAEVTTLIVMSVRIYTPMMQQPYDDIDPNMMKAVDVLFNSYIGAFTLGGAVRDVDVLGMYGTPLSAQAGYINQDGKVMRVMTINLPLVVNDAWAEVA